MAEKIKMTYHYDTRADVLYVDFGSDEPCFTEDLNGFLMIDIGWFSKLPRGIRIISPKGRKIKAVKMKMIITQAEKTCKQLMEDRVRQIRTEEPVLRNVLGQELNQAFTRTSINRSCSR